VTFNGKKRFVLCLPVDKSNEEKEKSDLSAPEAQKWLQGKPPKKIIIVPKKIVNIVV
jgi:leucyl-tRNA synthetase